MKKILSVLSALIVCFSLVSCAKDTNSSQSYSNSNASVKKDITFMLDWTPNTNHTGVYVALEKGFYEEEGINVKILQPAEDASIIAVGNGDADFGVTFQENLGAALAQENPIPVTAVATIINHNTSGIISLQEKNINTFKDLEGKTYATWGLPVEQEILKYAVESQGGDFSKVTMVPHSGADALSLLKDGKIDAVWVYEAWDNVMFDLNGTIYNYVPFADASTILDYFTPIIVTSDKLIEQSPETVKAFMRATAKGYEFAINHPEEASDILLKAVPELDKELVHESQSILANYYKAEADSWGFIDAARWSTFFDFMFAHNLIDKDIRGKGFTNEFLE